MSKNFSWFFKPKLAKVFLLEELKYRKNHIKSIKENIMNNNENLRKEVVMNRCPRCGNELVIRKGKSGEFIGCLSFPKCKYTKVIKNKNTEDMTLF